MIRKILFICNEGFDTPGPSNPLISTLIEDLLGHGFYVTLVQSRRQRTSDDLPDNLRGKDNLEVITIERKVICKNALLKRYLEEASYHFKAYAKWKKLEGFDAVFVQCCPTVVFSIFLLKMFSHLPILYSIQDMWPGTAVNSGVLKNKLIARFFYLLQKCAYKYSDRVTVLSEDMKAKVIQQGVPADKIHLVANWFDDHSVREVEWEKNRFVLKYGLDRKKFFVQYAGTIGYAFDYKIVLAAADLLKQNKDIQFQIVGRGSQKSMFVAEAQRKGLDNIVFYPFEPQDMTSDVYSACSVFLIPLKRGVIGNSVPSKASLLPACNRAIISSVDEDSYYYRTFNENKIGIAVSNNRPEDLAEAIMDLYKNREKRKCLAFNGLEFSRRHYSRSENTKKFIEVFEGLMKK